MTQSTPETFADIRWSIRKHGYPPDLQDAAVQTVLQQAETLSAR